MSERTQRINTTDIPGVREEHLREPELIDLSLGNLPTDEEDAARAHLNTCPSCRATLEALHLEDATGATKVRDPLVGSMLGEYRVDAALARGGMGVVYRGVQPLIGKHVAIKVLVPELNDEGDINRLLDEARAVNAIRHPNIIDIFSFGSLPGGRHYFVMELLDGQSLDDLIAQRRTLSPTEVSKVLEQSCSALGAAHLAGVVHRDLKPANLFVSVLPDGAWHITVLDFGLAKRVGNTRRTAANLVMGTPGYMAPEQIRGKQVTAQADLYSLGVVAWVLLTGNEPFRAEGLMDLLRAHIDEPLPSLRERAPNAPAGLVKLIERLLAKRPEDRPASAFEVRDELQALRARGQATGTPLVQSPRKHGVPAGMPTGELADALEGTHVRSAETKPRLEVPVEPAPRASAPRPAGRKPAVEPAPTPVPMTIEPPASRAGPAWRWPVVGLGVVAVSVVAWAALRTPPAKDPEPRALPPVVEPQPPARPLPEPTPVAVVEPQPVEQLPTQDAGPRDEGPTAAVDAGAPVKRVPTVKKAEPVDRRQRLTTRLQQLERRFSQAIARGASLELELAEVRGLRQKLTKAPDARTLDAAETAVERLEGLSP